MINQKSITARFHAYHKANPHVYRTLVTMCRKWRSRHGREAKLSIKTLFEVMRWEFNMSIKPGAEPWKLNNDFTSHYARLIMDCNPDLEGIFELREQKAV